MNVVCGAKNKQKRGELIMAGGTVAKSSAAKQAATTEAPVSAGVNVQARGLLDIARSCTQLSTLNAAGKVFVENLKAIIAGANCNINVTQISTDALEGVVIHTPDNAVAILLILADNCRYPKELSPTSLIPTFANLWKQMSGSVQPFAQAPTITPAEYDRVERIANTAINVIKVHLGEIDINLAAMTATGLNVSTNRLKAIDFIEAVSPHAVHARDDITLTISVNTKDDIIRPTTGFNQNEYQAETTICALTGYTDFVDCGLIDGKKKFRPIITITDVVSVIPSPKIIALLLPLAVDAFIQKRGWLAPFKRLGTGYPNIGNLVRDAKKKPVGLTKVEELDAFVNTMLVQPVLAMDVTDGRFRLPGMDAFVAASAAERAYLPALMDGLFGGNLFQSTILQATIPGPSEVIGVYRDQTMKDTRCLDYLEFSKSVPNTELYDKLLNATVHPLDRIAVQTDLIPEIIPMYIMRKSFIDANFATQVAAALASVKGINIIPDYNGAYNAGLPNLDGAQFSNFIFNVGGQQSAVLQGLPSYQPINIR